jgi:hypothetical protein
MRCTSTSTHGGQLCIEQDGVVEMSMWRWGCMPSCSCPPATSRLAAVSVSKMTLVTCCRAVATSPGQRGIVCVQPSKVASAERTAACIRGTINRSNKSRTRGREDIQPTSTAPFVQLLEAVANAYRERSLMRQLPLYSTLPSDFHYSGA